VSPTYSLIIDHKNSILTETNAKLKVSNYKMNVRRSFEIRYGYQNHEVCIYMFNR